MGKKIYIKKGKLIHVYEILRRTHFVFLWNILRKLNTAWFTYRAMTAKSFIFSLFTLVVTLHTHRSIGKLSIISKTFKQIEKFRQFYIFFLFGCLCLILILSCQSVKRISVKAHIHNMMYCLSNNTYSRFCFVSDSSSMSS